jgi:hypothetical protein
MFFGKLNLYGLKVHADTPSSMCPLIYLAAPVFLCAFAQSLFGST